MQCDDHMGASGKDTIMSIADKINCQDIQNCLPNVDLTAALRN